LESVDRVDSDMRWCHLMQCYVDSGGHASARRLAFPPGGSACLERGPFLLGQVECLLGACWTLAPTPVCRPAPMREHPRAGSVAAPSPPCFPKDITHQRRIGITKGNPAPRKPDTRSPRATTPLAPQFVRRLVRPRLLRILLTVPIFLYRWGRSPMWVLRNKFRTAWLHLSSASRSPTRYFCFPFFVAPLTLAHIAACWSLEIAADLWLLLAPYL